MTHTAQENFIYLTTAPVHRIVMKLAVPTIISMLVTSFYNMADTYFVGKLNTQSTAAVGIVFSAMAIIQAVGFFFGHGSGNYISRRLGAQDTANAERMAATGFFLAFFAGAALAVLGLIFLTPISVALGSTPTILPYTRRYLGIILLGAPFMAASLVLNNQIRFQGNAAYSMVGIVAGAVINVVLDPLLIFVCGLGITGAALATVLSQLCSFTLLLYMASRQGNIAIRFRNFTPSLSYVKEIIGGGLPRSPGRDWQAWPTSCSTWQPVPMATRLSPACPSCRVSGCLSTRSSLVSGRDSNPCAASTTARGSMPGCGKGSGSASKWE